MSNKVALYAGSFDPFTLGHHDIVLRALTLFDEVHILVAQSSSKNPLIPTDVRVKMIQSSFEHESVVVHFFNGLATDYAVKIGANFLIRGLRTEGDFAPEQQMAGMNAELNGKLDTIFLMSQPKNSHICSTLVREIVKGKGDYSKFVTKAVADVIAKL